jgi:hypothetical protein
MPAAAEVTRKNWTNVTVLFDNGEYSVISGVYEGGDQRVLGERWNGDESRPRGFPISSAYPVWHVAPGFLEIAILHALLDELAAHPNSVPTDSLEQYRVAILGELELRVPLRELS